MHELLLLALPILILLRIALFFFLPIGLLLLLLLLCTRLLPEVEKMVYEMVYSGASSSSLSK